MRIIFLAHVSSLSDSGLGWAVPESQTPIPKYEIRNAKNQLNSINILTLDKAKDKDSRQNKGQLTGGATRPQIAINMPEIGIQKMRIALERAQWGKFLQLGSTRRANRGNLCQNCCAENMRNCHCLSRRRTGGLSKENVWENQKKISPKRNRSKSGS